MLTQSQRSELDNELRGLVRSQIEDILSRKIVRRFTPGGFTNDSPSEFKSFGDFLSTVKQKPLDGRLTKAMSEGTDSLGGFGVPQEYANNILMASMESAIIRRFATKIPMSSDTINIPKIVDTSHASTLYGGLAGVWTEEAGSLTSDEPAFGQIKLICHKLLLYTITSNELLADFGQALETVILKVFGDSLGWTEDEAFINGDGVGKPLGILKSGALLTINRSAATTVAQSDVLNMWSRLLPQSHERCIWLVNPTVLPQLGAIAATALSWLSQDQGLAKPMPTSILGRPMYISEKCPALGTAGDIILLDPSFYLIGDRKILEMRASEQVRFATDETAWRMIERVAGHPWVDSKFTPLHGSTLSPFVTLYASTTGGD